MTYIMKTLHCLNKNLVTTARESVFKIKIKIKNKKDLFIFLHAYVYN